MILSDIISSTKYKHFIKDEVRVWYTFINKWEAQFDELKQTLTASEMNRLKLIHHEKLQGRYIVTRYILRALISSCFGIAPYSMEFETNDYGKPYLRSEARDEKINFNISHSGNLLVLGMCKDFDIGVDVEKIRSRKDLYAVSDKFFSPEENGLVNSFSGKEKLTVFYKLWILKEAYAKAKGIPMMSLLDKNREGKIELEDLYKQNFKMGDYSCHLFSLEGEYGFRGAIVSARPIKKLSFTEL
jgi:4'-phosphopantetheinyl transferase